MKKTILICVWILTIAMAQGQTIVLDNTHSTYRLSREVGVLKDSTNALTLEQVRQRDTEFKNHTANAFNFGGTDADFWLRFRLRNDTPTDQKIWLLQLSDPLLDVAEVYLPTTDGKGYRSKRSGDLIAFSEREVKDRYLVFRLDSLPKHQDLTIYIKTAGFGARHFTLSIWNEVDYWHFMNTEDVPMGVYVGILLAIMAYNFFLFIYLRDVSFLLYVPYVGFTLLQQIIVIGWGAQYLLPNAPWLANIGANLLIGVSMCFGAWFVLHFLNIRQIAPRLMWIMYAIFAIGGTIAIGTAVHYSFFVSKMTDILLMLDIILTFWLGIAMLRTGYPPARYFMLGWVFFLLSVFVAAFHNAGVIPANPLIDRAVFIGTAIQAILFSIGLGARFNQMRQEKEQMQLLLVKQLQENDRTRIRLARDLHDDVGSTLSSINILSQVAEKQVDTQPENIKNLLHRISQNAQRMMDTMSDIVWTTKPDNDNVGSLVVRMKEFAAEVLEAKDIRYAFEVSKELEASKLPVGRYYDFYLIFKEALNNAAKYSNASTITIQLNRETMTLNLLIKDNGQGFVLTEAKGNGLKNMQKRAEQLDGTLAITSQMGQGTVVSLRVPMADE